MPTVTWDQSTYPLEPQDVRGDDVSERQEIAHLQLKNLHDSFSEPVQISLWANEQLYVGREFEEPVTDAKANMKFFSLSSMNVSSRHFRVYSISYDPDGPDDCEPLVYCEDLQSTNGTWITGHDSSRILIGMEGSTSTPYLLSDGDCIHVKPQWDFMFVQKSTSKGGVLKPRQVLETQEFQDLFQVKQRALGSGKQATVFLALHHREQVACKVFDFPRLYKSNLEEQRRKFSSDKKSMRTAQVRFQDDQRRALREINLLMDFDHPNVASILKAYQSPHALYGLRNPVSISQADQVTRYIFSQLACGGDLFSYMMKTEGILLEAEALVVSRQVVKALEYIHGKGVVHRDVKPENILLTRNDVGHRVILTDFGHASTFSSDERPMISQVGTEGYAAPEVMVRQQSGYTQAVDLWSLGMVIAILLVGDTPEAHEDRTTQSQDELQSRSTHHFEYHTGAATDLVNQLLCKEAKLRPSASTVLQHAWYHQPAGLSQDLDDCERRALTNWKATTYHSNVVEQIADFVPSKETQAHNGTYQRPKRLPNSTRSPYFSLDRPLGRTRSGATGSQQQVLDEVKKSGTRFVGCTVTAEVVHGSDIFKNKHTAREDSVHGRHSENAHVEASVREVRSIKDENSVKLKQLRRGKVDHDSKREREGSEEDDDEMEIDLDAIN